MGKDDENRSLSLPLGVKSSLIAGALLCLTSVLIGAFAAHGLKQILTPYQLDIVQTGAKYQMYHGLAMLICALLMLNLVQNSLLAKANVAFFMGCILFSGSLYVLALTQMKAVAIVTPFGGLLFIVGWCLFLWAILKSPFKPIGQY